MKACVSNFIGQAEAVSVAVVLEVANHSDLSASHG
jgi:hypothetical protein